jgi:hypothetical protein
MPTRTEVDAAHRRIAELERALRRMRDAAPAAAGAGSAKPAAAKPAAKPAGKQAAKSAGKQAAKPASKQAAKPASKVATGRVAASTGKPSATRKSR